MIHLALPDYLSLGSLDEAVEAGRGCAETGEV